MSISQKTSWIQLVIFILLFIGWGVLAGINGTIFFWEDAGMKDTFYYTCAGAFAVMLGLNLTVGIGTRGRSALNDERDRAIFRTASIWAAGVTLTAIMAALLVLSIVYMDLGTLIPVHFPLFIALTAAALLMLIQSLAAVILYGRTIRHG